jgi:hypothetical protein
MSKRIIYKEKNIERRHPQDERILIEENVLELVKTAGFKHFNMEQVWGGFIWHRYVMAHSQTYRGDPLDSLAEGGEDYKKRVEDFKKLMKNKDISDDEISGPYSRDVDGKKLIGDVRKHKFQTEDMGNKPFASLCRVADENDWLVEIEYLESE